MTERMELDLQRLREIPGEHLVPEPFDEYFRTTAEFLLSVKKDADNHALYADILPEHYGSSYANPEYAYRMLGSEFGVLLSSVYAELRSIIPAVFEEQEEETAALLELFLELYFEFTNGSLPDVRVIREIYSAYLRDYLPMHVGARIRAQVDPEHQFAADIIRRADFSDVNYLYEFGEYVSEDTVKTARFINQLPEETVQRMADTFTEGYRLGFLHAKKDLSKKKTVQVIYGLGFERMIRAAFDNFEKMGLKPTLVRASSHLTTWTANRFNGYTGAIPNLQFDEDHRNDIALVMDEDFATLRKRVTQEAFRELEAQAGEHAGPAVMESFGEKPFIPETHPHAIRMSDYQTKMYLSMKNALQEITQRYIPEKERSFTIIDYPVPAIGEQFEDIFRETIRVNTLDSDTYGQIQQHLIDALDQGTEVHVLGKGRNETDLTIALHPLENPKTETIFENCVADVNIPVGEVFTSPKLQGTNGLLHVGHVFLEGYEFLDLKIILKDGMIADYSCGNFENPAEGRKYIEDHILFHHHTLTIGEFAIGTNTTAYRMMKQFGIESLMPILIAEKTGPHFAMGDTCYSWEEDNPVYNPDGKEIIARDNEHTLIRKTDVSKAYYGCHTDITIPYDELGSIRVIRPDQTEILLIDDGRFVLPGTEVLNEPLEGLV